MLLIPFAGIEISAGVGTLAVSSTAALLNLWATNKDNTGNEGDPAVKADQANNRLLFNSPGIYMVWFDLTGTIDGATEITVDLYKNGSAVVGAQAKSHFLVSTANNHISFHAIVTVNRSDSPANIATMPAASTTGFSGASGALQTEVPMQIYVTAGGSQTLTVVSAHLSAIRLR